MEGLCQIRGGFDSIQDFVLVSCDDSPLEARRTMQCLEYLGALNRRKLLVDRSRSLTKEKDEGGRGFRGALIYKIVGGD